MRTNVICSSRPISPTVFFFLYFSVLFVFVTYDYFYDRPFPVVINVLNQRVKMFRMLHIFSDSFGRYY